MTHLVTIPARTSSTLRLSRSPGWYMRSTRSSLSSEMISRTGRGKYDTPTSPYITKAINCQFPGPGGHSKTRPTWTSGLMRGSTLSAAGGRSSASCQHL